MLVLSPLKKSAVLALLFVLSSCVKNVELDQYDEIVVPPVVTMNLVFLSLDETNFIEPSGEQKIPADELRLEFLDDDYIQTGLFEAQFQFEIIHSFPYSFTVWVSLFSENGSLQHKFPIEVPPAVSGEKTVVNFIELIPEENISIVRRSIRMLVEVEMHQNSQVSSGEFKLKSKALYKFEF